ncbi:hypothetical protein MMPV_001514 [Pyropia vietnamensis]
MPVHHGTPSHSKPGDGKHDPPASAGPATCSLGRATVEVVGDAVVAVWNGLRCSLGAAAMTATDEASKASVSVQATGGSLYATLLVEEAKVSCKLVADSKH